MTDYFVAIQYRVLGATDEPEFWDYDARLSKAWSAHNRMREATTGADFAQRLMTFEAVWSGETPEGALGAVRMASVVAIGKVGEHGGLTADTEPYAAHVELTVVENAHRAGHSSEMRM